MEMFMKMKMFAKTGHRCHETQLLPPAVIPVQAYTTVRIIFIISKRTGIAHQNFTISSLFIHYFFTIHSLFLRHSFTISSPFFHYFFAILSLCFAVAFTILSLFASFANAAQS